MFKQLDIRRQSGAIKRETTRKLTTLARLSGDQQDKMPKKVGILEKWSPALFKNFSNRYVVLENKVLKYYNLQENGEPFF